MGQPNHYNPYTSMNGSAVPSYSINNPLSAPTGPGYQAPAVPAPVPSYPTSSAVTSPVGTGTSAVNKGPLAHKYPHSTAGASTYSGTSSYQQPMFNPLDYNQPNTNTSQQYNYGYV